MGNGFLEIVKAVDISQQGVGIYLPRPLTSSEIEAEVEIVLTLPAERPIHTHGVIRRREGTQSGIIGIEFVRTPAKALEALDRYIERRSVRRSLVP